MLALLCERYIKIVRSIDGSIPIASPKWLSHQVRQSGHHLRWGKEKDFHLAQGETDQMDPWRWMTAYRFNNSSSKIKLDHGCIIYGSGKFAHKQVQASPENQHSGETLKDH